MLGSLGLLLSMIYAFAGLFLIMRFWVIEEFYVYGIFVVTIVPIALILIVVTLLIIFDDTPVRINIFEGLLN